MTREYAPEMQVLLEKRGEGSPLSPEELQALVEMAFDHLFDGTGERILQAELEILGEHLAGKTEKEREATLLHQLCRRLPAEDASAPP